MYICIQKNNLREFEKITLYQIEAYSIGNRGYFTLFYHFLPVPKPLSGSSIPIQNFQTPNKSPPQSFPDSPNSIHKKAKIKLK